MPRPSKGARLYLPTERDGRERRYVIRDLVDGRRVEIACAGKGATDLAEAEKQLAEYVASKHDPEAGRKGDPNKVKLADAITVYVLKHVLPRRARPDAVKKCLDNINEKLGDLLIGEIDGEVQETYADERADEVVAWWAARGKEKDPSDCYAAPRKELEDMAAAINFYGRKKSGGVHMLFRPVLPDANDPHTRFMTRSEAAKLVWTAWRMKEDRNGHGRIGHNSGGRRTGMHIARLILIGLYTGTRKSPMVEAALSQPSGGLTSIWSAAFSNASPSARPRTTSASRPCRCRRSC
jgi:hypothetical protein